MVTIIYEVHATTLDNEAGLASGHFDVELSELGKQQAKEMGKRYASEHFDAFFCSDLKRSYMTAKIAFADRNIPIIQDSRLRECDYGDLTKHPDKEVEAVRGDHIKEPFPNGESYEQAIERVRSFLADLLKNYDGKKVLIIDHKITWYALEHYTKDVPLFEAITAPWHWQPGWRYEFKNL